MTEKMELSFTGAFNLPEGELLFKFIFQTGDSHIEIWSERIENTAKVRVFNKFQIFERFCPSIFYPGAEKIEKKCRETAGEESVVDKDSLFLSVKSDGDSIIKYAEQFRLALSKERLSVFRCRDDIFHELFKST